MVTWLTHGKARAIVAHGDTEECQRDMSSDKMKVRKELEKLRIFIKK